MNVETIIRYYTVLYSIIQYYTLFKIIGVFR